MTCDTCGKTTESVAILMIEPTGFEWCPRCGTLHGPGGGSIVPTLVESCRRVFGELLGEATVEAIVEAATRAGDNR